MSEPWYKDGLRFECTRCGKCCTGAPGFVWVNDEEIQQIAEHRGEPAEEVRGLYTVRARDGRSLREKANGDCVFFDRAAGCTIYPVRPRQCRTWPFWESNVATPDDWQHTRTACPGAGTGDFVSEEEIAKRIRVIRI